jgi:hypothetical protein
MAVVSISALSQRGIHFHVVARAIKAPDQIRARTMAKAGITDRHAMSPPTTTIAADEMGTADVRERSSAADTPRP